MNLNNFKSYHHLERIKEYLWKEGEFGQIALMIGAGFSLNATPKSTNAKRFPLWSELKKPMFSRLFPDGTDKWNSNDLTVMQLAEEYEAVFERKDLETLIESVIPDQGFEPGRIHIRALNFPWADIFTTNYDTLLERTASKIYRTRYSIVRNSVSLPFSEHPRIIKLHGTLQTDRPYILTNEDFRTYPQKFAPFVNSVQQSILENALLVFGFSGTDPNFLNWIGWARDHLGKKNMCPIYLFGVFNYSFARVKYFDSLGVTVIDFAELGTDVSPDRAIELLFDYLEEGKKTKLNSWLNEIGFAFQISEYNSEQVYRLANEWKRQRREYPGWIIAPENVQAKLVKRPLELFAGLNQYIKEAKDEKTIKISLIILFETCWRFEQCFFPLLLKDLDIIENLLFKFNFQNADESNLISLADESYDIPATYIQEAWKYLVQLLIKFKRINFDGEGFHKAVKILDESKYMDEEGLNFIHYQMCLYYYENLSFQEFKIILNTWSVENATPIWKMRKAAILADTGWVNEAISLASIALSTIRGMLYKNGVDKYLLSLEGWAILLLEVTTNSIDWGNFQLFEENRNRWKQLDIYDCNPLRILENLKYKVSTLDLINEKTEKEIPGFRENQSTIQVTMHNTNKIVNIRYAIEAIQFYEIAGVPVKCGTTMKVPVENELFLKALKWINPTPNKTLILKLLHFAKNSDFDIISRPYINAIDQTEAIELIRILEKAILDVCSANLENLLYEDRLGNIILVYGRLSYHKKYIDKKEIIILSNLLDLCRRSFNSDHLTGLKELLNIYFELDFNEEIFVKYFISLIKLPEVDLSNDHELQRWPDPFDILSRIKEKNNSTLNSLTSQLVGIVLVGLESELWNLRRVSVRRAVILIMNLKVEEGDLRKLGVAIWSHRNAYSNLPENLDGNEQFTLVLPHPDDLDPAKILKDYIFKALFASPFNRDAGGKIIGYAQTTEAPDNLTNIIESSVFDLSKERALKFDVEECRMIFLKMEQFWENNKIELLEDRRLFFVSTRKIIKTILQGLARVLIMVVYPVLREFENERKKMSLFILKLNDHGVLIQNTIPSILVGNHDNDITQSWFLEELWKKIKLFDLSDERKISDSLIEACIIGYFNWIILNFKNGTPENNEYEIMEEFYIRVRYRIKPGLKALINEFRKFINFLIESIDIDYQVKIGHLVFALEFLLNETALIWVIGRTIEAGNDNLDRYWLRVGVAKLAFSIKQYSLLKGLQLSPILDAWESIREEWILPEFKDIENVKMTDS